MDAAVFSRVAQAEGNIKTKIDNKPIAGKFADLATAQPKEWKGTDWGLFDATKINSNNALEFAPKNDGTSISQTTKAFSHSIYGNEQGGQGITTPSTSKYITEVEIELSIAGSPPDVIVEIQTDSSGAPSGTVVQSAIISSSDLSTSGWKKAKFDNPVKLSASTKYYLVVSCPTGNSSNYPAWYYADADYYSGGVRWITTDDWATSSSGSTQDWVFKIYYGVDTTSGSAERSITESSLVLWDAFEYTKTTGTNSSITIDVLDTNNNVLKSDISSGADLTDIDRDKYPTIKVKATLTRSTTSDPSPTLDSWVLKWMSIMPSGTGWEKYPIKTLETSVGMSTSYQTILSVTGKGFLDHATINSSNYDGYLKITVDGVIVHESIVNSGGYVGGLLSNKAISYGDYNQFIFTRKGTTYNTDNPSGYIASYPHTSAKNCSVVISNPIFFSESLKIESKNSTSSYTHYFAISGSW